MRCGIDGWMAFVYFCVCVLQGGEVGRSGWMDGWKVLGFCKSLYYIKLSFDNSECEEELGSFLVSFFLSFFIRVSRDCIYINMSVWKYVYIS